MGVKLLGALPDVDRNGLDVLFGELVKHPGNRHVAIVVIDSPSMKTDHTPDGDRFTPNAGVVFIEPVRESEDVAAVLDILGRVRAQRLDEGTLDFDFGVGDPLAKAASFASHMRDLGATVVQFGGKRTRPGTPDGGDVV